MPAVWLNKHITYPHTEIICQYSQLLVFPHWSQILTQFISAPNLHNDKRDFYVPMGKKINIYNGIAGYYFKEITGNKHGLRLSIKKKKRSDK